MRPALQRLLESPSALCLLRHVVQLEKHCICPSNPVKARRQAYTWRSNKTRDWASLGRREASAFVHATKDEDGNEVYPKARLVDYQEHVGPIEEAETNGAPQKPMATKQQEPTTIIQYQPQDDSWRSRILTFDQLQYQSNIEARLNDNPGFATDWELWLELIRFRNRHNGLEGARVIYKAIFRRCLQLPTDGDGADELWDLLLQSGFKDALWMQEIIQYSIQHKLSTGKVWLQLYGSIIGHALHSDQNYVLQLHRRLKEDFPPSIEDYRYLFERSLSGECVPNFMSVYRDLPVVGIYATVVPELCKVEMYIEARKWHHLLCINGDLPRDMSDIKPLITYFVWRGDDRQVERIIKRLDDNQDGRSSVPSLIRKYVAEKEVISREMMNQQLGEVHGVAPKHLSDEFCARLFATELIGINTIISGLQMMGVESIGPLSLREMAARDGCDRITVCQRLDRLKAAGISPDNSVFATVLVRLAHNNHHAQKLDTHHLLKSVVECDLHPDTFEDFELQERLLSQYYEQNDHVQIERTIAIITSRCLSERHRDAWRWNLTFRAYITLGRADGIFAILGEMQRKNIVLSARSSRHIRHEWLSMRNRGQAAQSTYELSVIVKASQMSMQSGHEVPIIAWREIMRRLGMAGRLLELENLAFWLTDHYLGITAPLSLKNHKVHPVLNKIPPAEAAELSTNSNVNSPLKVLLYHYAAQQAIVTWGFLHKVRSGPPSSKRHRRLRREAAYCPSWQWGLRLLKRLQERGVPIQKDSIARICKIRLLALFGNGVSDRPINREARWANDQRVRRAKGRRYRMEFYIREMEAIWGQDLFRRQDQMLGRRIHLPNQSVVIPVKGYARWTREKRWTRIKRRAGKRPFYLHLEDNRLLQEEIDVDPYYAEPESLPSHEHYRDEWE